MEKIDHTLQLYQTVRIPLTRFSRDVISVKYFVPLVVLALLLKDHGQLKPASIGLLIMISGVWFALGQLAKSIGPVRLKTDGSLSIPIMNDANRLEISRAEIAFLGKPSADHYIFLSSSFEVLGTLRPNDLEHSARARAWIQQHFAALSIVKDEKNWNWSRIQARKRRPRIGSKGFYPLLFALLAITASAIAYSLLYHHE
jgi:hypothetical protein